MKRIISLVLILTMTALCLGACRKDVSHADELSKMLGEVVLTIDGTPVLYETYRYYFYGIASAMTDGDLSKFEGNDALLAELREAVLDELKMEQVLRGLAREYGISITEENWAAVDRSIEELEYSYQTGLGVSLEDSVRQRYGTKKLLREMLAYGNYISDPVYNYIYDREHGIVDYSEETIREYYGRYDCVLHVLLSKTGYESEKNVEKTAEELSKILTTAVDEAARLTAESGAEELIAAIDRVIAEYESGKAAVSYIGRFSPYIDRLKELRGQLKGKDEQSARVYLKKCAEKVTSGEAAAQKLKSFAASLASEGVKENTAEEYGETLKAFREMLENEILAYVTGDVSFPAAAETDALFALEYIGAVTEDRLAAFCVQTLDGAFGEAVRIFGEDKEDPQHGVFFKKGSVDADFEEVYYSLETGGIGGPVKTRHGTHLLRRIEGDYDYFAKTLYDGYFVQDMLEEKMAKLHVEYTPFYETITPQTLK